MRFERQYSVSFLPTVGPSNMPTSSYTVVVSVELDTGRFNLNEKTLFAQLDKDVIQVANGKLKDMLHYAQRLHERHAWKRNPERRSQKRGMEPFPLPETRWVSREAPYGLFVVTSVRTPSSATSHNPDAFILGRSATNTEEHVSYRYASWLQKFMPDRRKSVVRSEIPKLGSRWIHRKSEEIAQVVEIQRPINGVALVYAIIGDQLRRKEAYPLSDWYEFFFVERRKR